MLTKDDINYLHHITAALRVPFEWGKDDKGFLVHVGPDQEERSPCRTLRDAVSCLAKEMPCTVSSREEAARVHAIFFPLPDVPRAEPHFVGLQAGPDLACGSD